MSVRELLKAPRPQEFLESKADPKKFFDWRGSASYDIYVAKKDVDGKAADALARNQAKGPGSDVVPDPPSALPVDPTFPPEKTYFQTIDETALQMQINPQPETAQFLEMQLKAVGEMHSTVQETVQLYNQ